ncbi:hypothetical protein SIM91_00770 [Rhodococcus opacus]|uniref:WD40/YVTN/BNR-like repeat-containing protein n=1 Tax=Rhodococcus TaxID=1827 RepID=UPI0013202EE1|nr:MULTISPECIES: hypothetical protein [Rhodococcus]MDX5961894.1 hypothetical protein [Rhodococcus opacus]QHE74310.1 Glycosyl hydrolase, BNR repeat precursor [Rhodococcus sp. WAY2]
MPSRTSPTPQMGSRGALIPAGRRKSRIWWAAAVLALVLVVGGVFLATRDSTTELASSAPPAVGGDLHTVTVVGDALYVGGHAAVAVSRDGGRQWQPVPSLQGADAMGWATTDDQVLVGGHPGLYRSSDGGTTFTPATGAAALPDVHALGGARATMYAGSPRAGLLASTDGGASWQVRSAQTGRSFMGTILVDPNNPDRLIAPDMAGGLTASNDGGRTWTPLGGPTGAMAAAWNPTDTRQVLAVGMGGAGVSPDGGATWRPVTLPMGATAVSYDQSGRTVYAGALDGQQARVYRSTDNGATWTPTA